MNEKLDLLSFKSKIKILLVFSLAVSVIFFLGLAYIFYFIIKRGIPFILGDGIESIIFVVVWFSLCIALYFQIILANRRAYPYLYVLRKLPFCSLVISGISLVTGVALVDSLGRWCFLLLLGFFFVVMMLYLIMFRLYDRCQEEDLINYTEQRLISVGKETLMEYERIRKSFSKFSTLFIVVMIIPFQYLLLLRFMLPILTLGVLIFLIVYTKELYILRYKKRLIYYIRDIGIYLLIAIMGLLLYYGMIVLPFKPNIRNVEIMSMMVVASSPFIMQSRYMYIIFEHERIKNKIKAKNAK